MLEETRIALKHSGILSKAGYFKDAFVVLGPVWLAETDPLSKNKIRLAQAHAQLGLKNVPEAQSLAEYVQQSSDSTEDMKIDAAKLVAQSRSFLSPTLDTTPDESPSTASHSTPNTTQPLADLLAWAEHLSAEQQMIPIDFDSFSTRASGILKMARIRDLGSLAQFMRNERFTMLKNCGSKTQAEIEDHAVELLSGLLGAPAVQSEVNPIARDPTPDCRVALDASCDSTTPPQQPKQTASPGSPRIANAILTLISAVPYGELGEDEIVWYLYCYVGEQSKKIRRYCPKLKESLSNEKEESVRGGLHELIANRKVEWIPRDELPRGISGRVRLPGQKAPENGGPPARSIPSTAIPARASSEPSAKHTKVVEAINVLQAIHDKANPITGEILPDDSILSSLSIQDALFTAIRCLERYQKALDRRKNWPAKVGEAWTPEEDRVLMDGFDGGKSVKELAAIHQRTRGAITSRLMKHGRMKPGSDQS